MKIVRIAAACFAIGLGVSGCSSTAQLNATLDTLSRNYAPCDRTLHYAFQAGAMNPGSGAIVQGDIHCPPHNPDGTPIAAPAAPVPPS